MPRRPPKPSELERIEQRDDHEQEEQLGQPAAMTGEQHFEGADAAKVETGCQVVFDATHSVQQAGGQGTSSGGER